VRAFVRDAFPATGFRRAGSIASAIKLLNLYPVANQAGLNNNYVVNRDNTRRHPRVRHAGGS
jgi:hypothetical protein